MERNGNRYRISLVFFILVLLFFQYAVLSASASDQDGNLIWIDKKANASSYEPDEDILYTINYGNNYDSAESARNVVVVDTLPKAAILGVSPPPYSLDGYDMTWVIGTLEPGENGSISLLLKHPEISELDFQEDSAISGDGYVNLRKRVSTIDKPDTLTNKVTIFATFDLPQEVSSSVTVELAPVPDVILRSLEHGSGYYNETLVSSLNNTKTNVKLSKELSAQHEPVKLSLPGQRTLQLSSLWSDRSTAWTDDDKTVNLVSDNYGYMKSIDKETSYDIAKTEINYSAAGNFSGGIAQIGYERQESRGKTPGKPKDSTYISETYHGDFQMIQKMDTYGDPTYEKEVSGTGFVSSQKVFDCSLRSAEQGSGSYKSEESIQSGTVQKNISLVHEPSEQAADASKIRYDSLWGEAMYTRNTEKGTEMINRFSSADYLQKDTMMSPSYMSVKGAFKGTNYMKARALTDVKNSDEEALRMERLLTGSFTLDTITIGGTIDYAYPHINLTKRVLDLVDKLDHYTVTYRIWVHNDGNQTLAPVTVVDSLPVEETFISSTLKPTVSGQNISWTLQALPAGETTVIDIETSLAYLSRSVINRVQAEAKYQNNTISAKAISSLYDTTLSEEEAEYQKELRLLEETVYGAWAPPKCCNLNSEISCTCERYFDAYYNNLLADCEDIP